MFTPNMPIASYHQPINGTCDFEKERGMVSDFIYIWTCPYNVQGARNLIE